MTHTSTFKVVGRYVLNVWRIMRSEHSLEIYTFENTVFQILRKRYASALRHLVPFVDVTKQSASIPTRYLDKVVPTGRSGSCVPHDQVHVRQDSHGNQITGRFRDNHKDCVRPSSLYSISSMPICETGSSHAFLGWIGFLSSAEVLSLRSNHSCFASRNRRVWSYFLQARMTSVRHTPFNKNYVLNAVFLA